MNLQGGNEFCNASLGHTPSPSILVKVQFLQQESKQTFPENLKFKKRHYHFQMEVVDYSLKTKKITHQT